MVTSVNRLVTACPYSAPHVEAPDPDIIVRRFRDLGKDHDPSDDINAMALETAGDVGSNYRTAGDRIANRRSPRLHNSTSSGGASATAVPGGEQGSKKVA